jgi:hypothetical protein
MYGRFTLKSPVNDLAKHFSPVVNSPANESPDCVKPLVGYRPCCSSATSSEVPSDLLLLLDGGSLV